MTMTEPGLDPNLEEAMRQELAPDQKTPEQEKSELREARIDRVLDEADQAPNPDAAAEETSEDIAGINRMNASPDGVDPIASVESAVTVEKAIQLDGLRQGVARAAEAADQRIAQVDTDTAEHPDQLADLADEDKKSVLEGKRDDSRTHQETYQRERMATLAKAADQQEAQHTQKEPLWDKAVDELKKRWPFGKKPTDGKPTGGEN